MSYFGVFQVLWVYFVVFLSSSAACSADDVARLHRHLFSNYSVHVRPKLNQSEPTTMDISMSFIIIHQLDMKTQILKSSGWLNTRWTDEFLTWKPEDYGGIEKLTISETFIWKPDLLPYNIVDGKRTFGSTQFLVRIMANGRIFWDPDFILETRCPVDITYFPFGTQMCQIELLSWELDRTQLALMSPQKVPDMKWCMKNGEFDIKGLSVIHSKKWTVDILKFSLVLKRRVLFYVFALVLPVVLLSLLCIVSFLVPMESGERMTISMTTLLSFTVYMGVVDELMPKTSETVSLLVVYVTTLLAISLMTVLGNATVLFIYYRWGKRRSPDPTSPHQTEVASSRFGFESASPGWNNSQPVTNTSDWRINVARDSRWANSVLNKRIGLGTGNETENENVESKHEANMVLNDISSDRRSAAMNKNTTTASSFANENVHVAKSTRKRSASEMASLVNVVLMFAATFSLLAAILVVGVIIWEHSSRPDSVVKR